MKTAPLVMLLAALALLGLRLRIEAPGDLASGVFAAAPGTPECERDAWRLRLVELAHAGGSAATEDRHLAITEVSWPPLFTVGMAQLARRLGVAAQPAPNVPDDRGAGLRRFVQRALTVSGALAILAVFLCARALAGGSAADLVGLVAAGSYALLPPIVFAERVGRVDPHAWSTLLGCGILGGVALALRAKQEVDASLGGLLAGAAAGLAFACDVGSLPLIAGGLAALALTGLRGRPDLRRACVLFLVAAAVLGTMPWHLPSWERLLPERMAWSAGEGFERLRAWPAVALLPAALIALGIGPRRGERTALQVLAVAAIAWALLVDPHSASVHLVAVLTSAVAVGDVFEAAPRSRRPLPLAALVLLASPAFLFARAPSYELSEEQFTLRSERASELQRFSSEMQAPAPWNHPSARSDWRVLTAPGFGASTALALRLPVLAARVPGVRSGELERASLAEAVELFAHTDAGGFAAAARRAGVAFVVLTPAMAGDPLLASVRGAGDGLPMLERLLSALPVEGLERVLPEAGRGLDASDPALLIWRVPDSTGERGQAPAVLRSR